MSNKIRLILGSYLSNFDLEIQSISFLKGGNISKDSLTVQYYAKEKGQWNLCTDTISAEGEITKRKTPAAR
jgi:hypothetical protein